jgi:hypothetical protein
VLLSLQKGQGAAQCTVCSRSGTYGVVSVRASKPGRGGVRRAAASMPYADEGTW